MFKITFLPKKDVKTIFSTSYDSANSVLVVTKYFNASGMLETAIGSEQTNRVTSSSIDSAFRILCGRKMASAGL